MIFKLFSKVNKLKFFKGKPYLFLIFKHKLKISLLYNPFSLMFKYNLFKFCIVFIYDPIRLHPSYFILFYL